MFVNLCRANSNSKKMTFEPIVKWSGSKRSQAEEIVARLPQEIDTYYEPFCGGCSVLFRLLNTPSIKVKKYVASDINEDLIGLWTMIKFCPMELYNGYVRMWNSFNGDPYADIRLYQRSRTELYSHRKEYFENVRARYNEAHSPIDFLFIMRTTTNGMPRYNDNGMFNNSCHFSRPGIHPRRLKDILDRWSDALKSKNVEFSSVSYNTLNPGSRDVLYLDPPYASVHKRQMYFGGIDIDSFVQWLSSRKCRWILSFDGKRGETDCTYDLPKNLYVRHEYLNAGNSSFERYLGKGRTEHVFESLYMNYIPSIMRIESPTQLMLF